MNCTRFESCSLSNFDRAAEISWLFWRRVPRRGTRRAGDWEFSRLFGRCTKGTRSWAVRWCCPLSTEDHRHRHAHRTDHAGLPEFMEDSVLNILSHESLGLCFHELGCSANGNLTGTYHCPICGQPFDRPYSWDPHRERPLLECLRLFRSPRNCARRSLLAFSSYS